jgi:hypothetical protein
MWAAFTSSAGGEHKAFERLVRCDDHRIAFLADANNE